MKIIKFCSIQQLKEYFEKKRKSNDGVGFLFNNFFGDADDSFIDHVSGQMAKGAFMAKLLADKIKSADQSPRVKQELSEALKTAVAAMKTKNSQESEGSKTMPVFSLGRPFTDSEQQITK